MQQKNMVKQGLKIDTYTVKFEGQDYSYAIQTPQFKQLSAALSVGVGLSGALNMAEAGRAIFETCCTEHSPEIENNPRLLVAVCIELFNEYVLPVEVEIKKN